MNDADQATGVLKCSHYQAEIVTQITTNFILSVSAIGQLWFVYIGLMSWFLPLFLSEYWRAFVSGDLSIIVNSDD